MSRAEVTYSWRGLKRDKYKISKFYVMVKVHKKSNKLRPIVWYLHMVLCSLGAWLDYKLKQLMPFVSTYIKHSKELLEKIKEVSREMRMNYYQDIETDYSRCNLRV